MSTATCTVPFQGPGANRDCGRPAKWWVMNVIMGYPDARCGGHARNTTWRVSIDTPNPREALRAMRSSL